MIKKSIPILIGLTLALLPFVILSNVSPVVCILVDLVLACFAMVLLLDEEFKAPQMQWIVFCIFSSFIVQSAWAIWA